MERLNFLQCFSTFTRLLKETSITLPFTGVSISFAPTLFDDLDLIIDDVSYSGLGLNDAQFFEQVIVPLVEVLEIEERFCLLQETMDLSKIWNYHSFQEFARRGEFTSVHSDEFLKLNLLFVDNGSSTDYVTLEDLKEDYITLDNLQVYYVEEEAFEFTNWILDHSIRLKVITGVRPNPNLEAQERMIEFFNREEVFEIASKTTPVSNHYSDFENNRIAFNIKVHELFVHDTLYKLDLISYFQENENRKEALQSLIDDMCHQIDFEFIGCTGRSDGYAIFQCDELTPSKILEACQLVEKTKENAASYYQTLEAYEHCFDDFLLELKDMDQDNDDVRQLICDIQHCLKTT